MKSKKRPEASKRAKTPKFAQSKNVTGLVRQIYARAVGDYGRGSQALRVALAAIRDRLPFTSEPVAKQSRPKRTPRPSLRTQVPASPEPAQAHEPLHPETGQKTAKKGSAA